MFSLPLVATFGRGLPYVMPPPAGTGQNDWDNIVAALTAYKMVQLRPGRYEVRTTTSAPNNSVLFGTPQTELAAFGANVPAFRAVQIDGVQAGVQQAQNARWTTDVLMNAPIVPGTVVSPRPILGLGDDRQSIPYRVEAVTPAGPNFVWTLNRPLNTVYGALTPWFVLLKPIANVALVGNGMTLTGEGHLIELREGYGVRVEQVYLSGQRCSGVAESYGLFATGVWNLSAEGIHVVDSQPRNAGIVCWECRDGQLQDCRVVGSGVATSLSVGIDRDDSVNVNLANFTVAGFTTGLLWSSNAGAGVNPYNNGSWSCATNDGEVQSCNTCISPVECNKKLEITDVTVRAPGIYAVNIGGLSGTESSDGCVFRRCNFEGTFYVEATATATTTELEECRTPDTIDVMSVDHWSPVATVILRGCQLAGKTQSVVIMRSTGTLKLEQTVISGPVPAYGIECANVACNVYVDARSSISTANPVQIQTNNNWHIEQDDRVAQIAMPAAAGYILTFGEYQSSVLQCTGALAANTNLFFPAVPGMRWSVVNDCTGSPNNFRCYSLADDGVSAGQKGVGVAQGFNAIVGTNATKHSQRLSADVQTQVP